jgi:hypothetical protein
MIRSVEATSAAAVILCVDSDDPKLDQYKSLPGLLSIGPPGGRGMACNVGCEKYRNYDSTDRLGRRPLEREAGPRPDRGSESFGDGIGLAHLGGTKTCPNGAVVNWMAVT